MMTKMRKTMKMMISIKMRKIISKYSYFYHYLF